MSKKLFLLPALVMGAFLLFMPACGESDPCKDVECGANGICIEGTCDCDPGYELGASSQCDVEWATKFLGSYTGTDGCGGALTQPVNITRISERRIRITNFGGFGSYVDADIKVVSGTANAFELNNFVDPAQRRFTGSGTLTGNAISATYTVTYTDGTSETCTFNITK
ncbi:MAG: hypothetical protein KF734_15180 [Saprospiraceae bacterium]|nr:hypothetical protein [Saprospiraceae bacterium]